MQSNPTQMVDAFFALPNESSQGVQRSESKTDRAPPVDSKPDKPHKKFEDHLDDDVSVKRKNPDDEKLAVHNDSSESDSTEPPAETTEASNLDPSVVPINVEQIAVAPTHEGEEAVLTGTAVVSEIPIIESAVAPQTNGDTMSQDSELLTPADETVGDTQTVVSATAETETAEVGNAGSQTGKQSENAHLTQTDRQVVDDTTQSLVDQEVSQFDTDVAADTSEFASDSNDVVSVEYVTTDAKSGVVQSQSGLPNEELQETTTNVESAEPIQQAATGTTPVTQAHAGENSDDLFEEDLPSLDVDIVNTADESGVEAELVDVDSANLSNTEQVSSANQSDVSIDSVEVPVVAQTRVEAPIEPSALQDIDVGIELTKRPTATVASQVASTLSNTLISLDKEPVQTVLIDVHPAELGRLNIRVEKTGEQIVATIAASEMMSVDLLAKDKNFLMEALAEMGISDAQVDVFHKPSDQAESQFQSDQSQQRFSRDGSSTESQGSAQSTTPGRTPSGGVDLVA